MLAEGAPVGARLLLGAALFGLGAALNGACALGTVAQLTRGRGDFLGTLAGLGLGAAAAIRLGIGTRPALPSAVAAPGWLGFAALAVFAAVALPVTGHLRRSRLLLRPRLTTVLGFVILGVCGGLLNATAGDWTYTSLLTGAAGGALGASGRDPMAVTAACAVAIFAGGLVAAARSGRLAPARPTLRSAAPKLAGGAMMSFGAMMIPGGNDMLLFAGLPSLDPGAWLAYAAMIGSLVLALTARRRWLSPRAPVARLRP
jgi:hypothetical protein